MGVVFIIHTDTKTAVCVTNPVMGCPMTMSMSSNRICTDYKDRVAKLDPYHPFSRIEDLFAFLAGGKLFKLDIAHAYQQMPLDNASKQFVVITPTRGSSSTTGYRSELHLFQQFPRRQCRASH